MEEKLAQFKGETAVALSELPHTAEKSLKKVFSLVGWDQLPSWQQDNHFIRSGYRPASGSYLDSFQSLGYLHNETVNVYSHLLGAISVIFAAALLFSAIGERYPLADADDLLVLSCYFTGAVACLGMSATYHLISNHSETVAQFGNKLDYLGIVSLIWGSFIPTITTIGAGCAVVSINSEFRKPKWRPFRATMFVGMGLSAVFPVFYGVKLYGIQRLDETMGLSWVVLQGLLYVLGAAIYAAAGNYNTTRQRQIYVTVLDQLVNKMFLTVSNKQLDQKMSDFLRMPIEIRSAIYDLVLVQTSPITIWSAKLEWKPILERRNSDDSKQYLKYDNETMSQSRRALDISLLRVSPLIGAEAANLFYARNTFGFSGDHRWTPIISWLHTIGDRNRSSLRSLVVDFQQPTTSWQYADGSRIPIGGTMQNEFWQRNRSFSTPTLPVKEGEVENVDPATETFITLLSRRDEALPLSLNIKVAPNLIPGVLLLPPRTARDPDDEDDYRALTFQRGMDRYLSMDIPNLIEKWRLHYGSEPNALEVVWQVETEELLIKEKKALMQEAGWVIVSEQDGERIWRVWPPFDTEHTEPPRISMIRFSLKMNIASEAPLVASDPIPYSMRTGPNPGDFMDLYTR
ncbi:MAG: hypothetical protein M1821_009276 [Bathelium mastoideum]|nr:MAG: hypothetical protein M1821_009276 [Bathelium mastoideum]